MRARAMAAAGMVLSQPTTQTTASNICPRQTSSMESATTSRLTSDARMPSVPMVSPSEMAIVLNSMGVPPAARMPSFTLAESRQVKIARHGFNPGIGDADDGLLEVFVSEADALEHGAGRGAVASVGDAMTAMFGIHRSKNYY